MKTLKEKAIREIIDSSIKNFAEGFELRYSSEVDDDNGIINSKKNNVFIAELGEELIFYSAFVRSFDSSFGNLLENMGNSIAKLSYDVRGKISSYLLPQQTQHIDYLMTAYEKHDSKPSIEIYKNFTCLKPSNISSYETSHETDNYFYDNISKKHFLIELKAGGDLDNKKAKAEKIALLNEYFILKNSLNSDEEINIYFATAYNKFGEGKQWKQERVRQYFADEELMIGKDYWNFVFRDENGFDVVLDQYRKSVPHIKNALNRIKKLYFEKEQI